MQTACPNCGWNEVSHVNACKVHCPNCGMELSCGDGGIEAFDMTKIE